MDEDKTVDRILKLTAALVRRLRLQRAADLTLFALVPASFLTVLATVFSLPVWVSPAGILLILLTAFLLGLLQPVDRRHLLLSVDRHLQLKESLITAAQSAASGDTLNELQTAQLEQTVNGLEGYPLTLLLPWSPPAMLPLAPVLLVLLALIIPVLPSLPHRPDQSAVVQARELVERLAARSEETGDTRFEELTELLREVVPAVPGNEERARPGEEASPTAPQGLERLPPLEERSNGDFRFDEDLEALFRLEPRRSGNGYALSRSLAEALGLTPDELKQLEDEMEKLDRSGNGAGGNDDLPETKGSAGGSAGENLALDSTAGDTGDAPRGEAGNGDQQQPGDESRPGGGSGTAEGRRSEESYTPGEKQLGAVEKLEGKIRGEDQLRGVLRFLSPEGSSLVKQETGETEYPGIRQSPRSGRESRPEYERYIGEYFRLLHDIESGQEVSQ